MAAMPKLVLTYKHKKGEGSCIKNPNDIKNKAKRVKAKNNSIYHSKLNCSSLSEFWSACESVNICKDVLAIASTLNTSSFSATLIG